MRELYKILKKIPFLKSFLATGMILLLLFLTSVNYFRFSDKASSSSAWVTDSQDDSTSSDNPAGPDEKSPSNGSFSFTEEYIHENHHTIHPFWVNSIFLHQLHQAGKIGVVHFELLSPPPEA